jgi:hypothetical protein
MTFDLSSIGDSEVVVSAILMWTEISDQRFGAGLATPLVGYTVSDALSYRTVDFNMTTVVANVFDGVVGKTSFDVTGFISSAFQQGSDYLGFVVDPRSDSRLEILGRLASSPDDRPTLVVTTSAVPEAGVQGLLLAAAGGISFFRRRLAPSA